MHANWDEIYLTQVGHISRVNQGLKVCRSGETFHLQSFTKYLRQLQFSCEIVHYGKSSIYVFQEIFASTD